MKPPDTYTEGATGEVVTPSSEATMTEQFGSEQTGDHAAAIDVANEITGGPWLPEYVNLARCYLELSSTAASTAAKVREMETRIAELERAVKARTSRMEGLPYTGPY